MKMKYHIYQLKCRFAKKPSIDYIEFIGRTLFFREGVRV